MDLSLKLDFLDLISSSNWWYLCATAPPHTQTYTHTHQSSHIHFFNAILCLDYHPASLQSNSFIDYIQFQCLNPCNRSTCMKPITAGEKQGTKVVICDWHLADLINASKIHFLLFAGEMGCFCFLTNFGQRCSLYILVLAFERQKNPKNNDQQGQNLCFKCRF